MFIRNLNIVVVDDDALIRSSLKMLISNVSKDSKLDVKLYSSSDGIDGLGLIYVSNPDLIIIDSTLPRYSGREIIDFLVSSDKYRNKSIIVLNDNVNKLNNLPPNYQIINKSQKNFVSELTKGIKEFFDKNQSNFVSQNESFRMKTVKFLVSRLINIANNGDLLMYKISTSKNVFTKLLFYIPWILTQIGSSFLFTILLFIYRQVNDANVEQGKKDLLMFRVRTYPTLAMILVAIIFFILQFALFLGGGLIIFSNIKIASVFADYSRELKLPFSEATYNNNSVEVIDGVLRLKATQQVLDTNQIQENTQPEEDLANPEENIPTKPIQEPQTDLVEKTVTEPTPEISVEKQVPDQVLEQQINNPPEEVLGASTDNLQQVTVSTAYPISKEEVVLNTKISYSSLVAFYEESNFNTKQESLVDINATNEKRRPKDNEELALRVLPVNGITYQLSPDNTNWYYYSGGESRWENTFAKFYSSNTIQELNQYLSLYVENIGGNDLYVKVILSSDGNTPVELRQLVAEREIYIVSTVNIPEGEVLDNPSDQIALDPLNVDLIQGVSYPIPNLSPNNEIDFENEPISIVIPVPVIFQASSSNGNKIIYGKIMTKINEPDLSKFKVKAYSTLNTDISNNAILKGEFIGEATLQLNPQGELTFLINGFGNNGGLVTVQLVYTNTAGIEISSELSNPLES